MADKPSIEETLRAHHEQIVRVQAECMATQILLTGLLMQVQQLEVGPSVLKSAFDYASDVAVAQASQGDKATNCEALVVGMLDHWRNLFKA
ncbi:hypothetical protein [Chelativorans sp. AA-79]|uniref:hypothetical protein n=1 Tax=Chelativorans sp. AA-79 TaxID=3028735 RepID=UPI0023F6D12F|nr:hypothetical protein [Chelativorans sp. AA-79]WEX10267.1 hypothetical protein PVE73_04725 [Chelativorans sp. AA-79]